MAPMKKLRLTPLLLLPLFALAPVSAAHAQLGLSGLLGDILPGDDSSGLVGDVIDGVTDTVDDVIDGAADAVDGVLGPIGGAVEELLGDPQTGILEHGVALEAVAQGLALPLDRLLSIIAPYLPGPVIDVQLLWVLETLVYEVKTIGDGGVVYLQLFYAGSGEPVRDQGLIDAHIGG